MLSQNVNMISPFIAQWQLELSVRQLRRVVNTMRCVCVCVCSKIDISKNGRERDGPCQNLEMCRPHANFSINKASYRPKFYTFKHLLQKHSGCDDDYRRE